MWEPARQIAARSLDRVGDSIANFLPGLLAFLAIVLVALAVAGAVRILLLRFLRRVRFDQWADRAGFSAGPDPALLLTRLAAWTIMLLGLLAALPALDSGLASYLAVPLLRYLPHLLAAALILLAGHWVARFLARSVLISAVNMQIHSARLLSLGVKWLVLVLAAAMALEHLGIGRQIVLLAFAILFGGIVLALALAVGLGSKEMVGRSLERQFSERREEEEEIRHL